MIPLSHFHVQSYCLPFPRPFSKCNDDYVQQQKDMLQLL